MRDLWKRLNDIEKRAAKGDDHYRLVIEMDGESYYEHQDEAGAWHRIARLPAGVQFDASTIEVDWSGE